MKGVRGAGMKPCPHCQSAPPVLVDRKGGSSYECEGCGCSTAVFHGPDRAADAAEQWDCRPIEDGLRRQVETESITISTSYWEGLPDSDGPHHRAAVSKAYVDAAIKRCDERLRELAALKARIHEWGERLEAFKGRLDAFQKGREG